MCETYSNNLEEMNSFEVLPTQNGMPESFDSSEFSLISELPQLSAESTMQQSANSVNMHSAFMSATQDLSVDEIQKRLIELVEDNETMKEALKWNNAMMKEQLSTISAWHSQMTTSMAQQQISLKEASDKIQELEKDNADLLEKLKQVEAKPKEVVDTQTSIKPESTTVSDEESAEYEIVQKKSRNDESLNCQLKEAADKVSSLEQEIEKQNLEVASLTKLLEKNNDEISFLKSQLGSQDEINLKCTNLMKKIDEYEVSIEQMKASEELKTSELRANVKHLQDEVQKYQLEPAVEIGLVDEYQENIDILKERHERAIKKLEEKMKNSEEELVKELQRSEDERTMHRETKKRFEVLQSNYDRVTRLLQIQTKDQKEMNEHMDSEREMEARRNLEQIDNLTAKLFDLEQKLEEREEKVQELTKDLDLLKKDSESFPILKAQVEVYKIDLNNAVLAKEAAHEEVENLTQQVKDLQVAASFCANCGAGSAPADSPTRGGRGRRRAVSHRQSESHQRSETELIICPVCEFGFTDLQAAENHVNSCIDKAL